MADARVAADARHGAAVRRGGVDIADDVLMTFAAGVLRHAPAAFLDLDRVVKVARRKRERMKEAVLGFRKILWHEPRRRVAIVARGDRAMT